MHKIPIHIKYLFIVSMGLVIAACSSSGNVGPKNNAKLQISSVQPTSGPVGTVVTIKGSGFSKHNHQNTVVFDSSEAVIDSSAADIIKTHVPKGASSGNILVAVDGDTVSGPNFKVKVQSPGISSIEPDSGTAGTKVTINGMNFSSNISDVTVRFNQLKASVSSASEKKIETEVPKNATDGPVEVTVKNKSTTGPKFDVLGPKITSVNPDTTVKGAKITIKGEHFSEKASDNILVIGGAQATVSSASDTTLVAKVPSGASQDGMSLTVGELSDQADLHIITEIQACYGNDVHLDATLKWVSQGLTSADNDKAEDMAMDANGNLYMIIRDRGVVGKFDYQGNEIWSKNLSGKLPKTKWRGIAIDGQKIYIVGQRQVLTSNLGAAKLEYHASKLIDDNPRAGTADPILARLDASNGGLQWAQEFGSTDLDELYNETVAVLPSGEILVGSSMGGPYTPNNHEPQVNPVKAVGIAKFTASGKLETVKQFDEYETIQSLVTDDHGRVYAGVVSATSDTPRYYLRLNSDLKTQVKQKIDAQVIKQPIPFSDGAAVIYGSYAAFMERVDANGNQVWRVQHNDAETPEYIRGTTVTGGVQMPGGGIVSVAENASAIGGLPYLEIFAEDGTPLLIDADEKTTFFEFEDDKKGRGYPTAVETYKDAQGETWVLTLGVTTSSWANRDDPDADNPTGGADMWMTGMTLGCKSSQ